MKLTCQFRRFLARTVRPVFFVRSDLISRIRENGEVGGGED